MVGMRYCTYLEKYLPETEFYSSQGGSKSKQYYKDSAKKHTNKRIGENISDLYRKKYYCPDNCVYALKSNGEIIYIGSSRNTPYRLYQHLENVSTTGKNIIFESDKERLLSSWVILWHGEDGDNETRIHQEILSIQLHQPKYNKIKYKNYEG